MPQLTGLEGTVLGAILIFLGYVIKVVWSKRGGGDSNAAMKTLIETSIKASEKSAEATNELILYMKTRDASKDASNEAYAKQLDRIEVKIDDNTKTLDEHCTRCKSTCLKG
jgi:hypothetical protein